MRVSELSPLRVRLRKFCHEIINGLSALPSRLPPAATVHYRHWRRQLWGTGARAPPPRLPAIVILGITRFTDSDESCARFSVQ